MTTKKRNKLTSSLQVNIFYQWKQLPFSKYIEEAAEWIENQDKWLLEDAVKSENLLVIAWVFFGSLIMWAIQFAAGALILFVIFSIIAYPVYLYAPKFYLWSNNFDLGILKLFGQPIWEWMKLLVVPLILSVTGLLLRNTLENKERSRKNEEILTQYLDQISELILSNEWTESVDHKENSKPNKVASVIRARTLVAARRLDRERVMALFKFLSESDVIQLVSFRGLNLSRLLLEDVSCAGIDFKKVNLNNSSLKDVNFNKADIDNSNLRYADIEGSSFNNASLRNSDFMFSSLKNVSFQNANLSGANFEHSDMKKIDFSDSDLDKARFVIMRLKDTDFTNATARSSRFESLSLVASSFRGANLSNATFTSVDLKNADFSNADLSEISFDIKDNWEESIGLDLAHNVPILLLKKIQKSRLKKGIGLRRLP